MHPTRWRRLEILFAANSFVGASLIFWVEPLFARMMLPTFGGSPAVWTTALMFYQGVLLAGYCYAHLLTRVGGPRHQALIHLGLLGLAGLFGLPPTLPPADWLDPTGAPVGSVLLALTSGLGLPLLALTATAPLVQRWFAQTGHPAAADPYFLYAASNAGSLLALLAFPFVLEPLLGLEVQRAVWTAGFGLLAGLLALCALRATGSPAAPGPAASEATPGTAGGMWRWIALAAVPASLLSGVTTKITMDIATAPLFWTVPLALYLLTFILAFARRQIVPVRLTLALQAVFLVPAAVPFLTTGWVGAGIVSHVAVFFFSALLCHGELARSRPGAAGLTRFYLALAVGGLLGGSVNALVAPNLFTGIVEYPLALVLAVALRPGRWVLRDLILPAVAVAVAGILLLSRSELTPMWVAITAIVLVVAAITSAPRPLSAAGLLAGAFLVLGLLPDPGKKELHVERNFFGILRAYHNPVANQNVLVHGTTLHGAQQRDEARAEVPFTYYHASGPLGEALAALPQASLGATAVIGLGAGTMACHLRAARSVRFYEIDPAVVSIARRPEIFSFLARCRPEASVEIGDGRLRLAAADQDYSLLVVDAFSSDSIPTHLLTREAMRLYADRLAPGGVLMIHFSNRFLDLAPVIGAVARAEGVSVLARCGDGDASVRDVTRPACWAVLAREEATLAPLAQRPGWRTIPADSRPWTDDSSDLLSPLLGRILAR